MSRRKKSYALTPSERAILAEIDAAADKVWNENPLPPDVPRYPTYTPPAPPAQRQGSFSWGSALIGAAAVFGISALVKR